MSFRRPKKPIRPRVVALTADSDEDEPMQVDSPPPPPVSTKERSNNGQVGSKLSFDNDEAISFNKPSKSKKGEKSSSKAAALLSFDDDLDGEEEGEVFQVKKSSVSRRLMKQRDKEKKGTSSSSSSKSKNPFGSSTNQEENSTKLKLQVDGFVAQLKIKKEPNEENVKPVIKLEKDSIRVLNGREAEALHMESDDDNEDDDNEENGSASYGHKFRRPAAGGGAAIHDAVRRALAQGQIPDANLIHEARKRKQMAREMGGGAGPEFVPVDNVDRYVYLPALIY